LPVSTWVPTAFRVQVGRIVGDQIHPLDTLRETCSAGFRSDQRRNCSIMPRSSGRSTPCAVSASGCAVLRRSRASGDDRRDARRAERAMVLPQAEAALGFPIEIIGGREEARLIFIGAANALPAASIGVWWSISAAARPS
jgi:exopolyphosphatase/guanosine-5'-triphosphate,3'-diphosphate pyrophosphatase